MFSYIYALHFTDAKILAPSFAGAQLLKECNNLRLVGLAFGRDDFPYCYRNWKGSQTLVFDKKAFLESHSFRQLLTLKHIEKVSQTVVPEYSIVVSHAREHIRMQSSYLRSTFTDAVPVL